jgi:hypothetical protein
MNGIVASLHCYNVKSLDRHLWAATSDLSEMKNAEEQRHLQFRERTAVSGNSRLGDLVAAVSPQQSFYPVSSSKPRDSRTSFSTRRVRRRYCEPKETMRSRIAHLCNPWLNFGDDLAVVIRFV